MDMGTDEYTPSILIFDLCPLSDKAVISIASIPKTDQFVVCNKSPILFVVNLQGQVGWSLNFDL